MMISNRKSSNLSGLSLAASTTYCGYFFLYTPYIVVISFSPRKKEAPGKNGSTELFPL
jgi:hypothetical protein